eukprot:TRINITY_DN2572_c1_g1_i2.p1 TRINITY_DN2572_c1_g1~~TRINITY_DN2572_c1_g1_i2.p1  ORF type:complete len:687 (-),score=231.37 TRINITY_DN2572_c1_g1_i2:56-2116(-)
MEFASEYVLADAEDDVEEIDVTKVEQTTDELLQNAPQQQGMPPPPPHMLNAAPMMMPQASILPGNMGVQSFVAPPPPPKPYAPPMPLMQTKARVKKVNTNVISVDLGSLEKDSQLMTGDPVFCNECKAAFSSFSKIVDGVWNCEFCNAKNQITLEEEEIPKVDTTDYILEPAKEIDADDREESIIFCMDISGSMCVTTEISGSLKLKGDKTQSYRHLNNENMDQYMPGQRRDVTYISRLQCVQAAIDQQLEALAKEHPKAKVGLVCFNNEVKLLGDGTQEPLIIAGDKLYNYDAILELGKTFKIANCIKESKEVLSKKLYEIEETGSTALGPAVVASLGMALGKPGGGVKLVIATDGLSNTGIGSLDSLSSEGKTKAAQFYAELGHFAKQNNVSVNVISIRGEEVSLEAIGKLADLTEGNVEIVDPLNIKAQFATILESKLVATKVSVKLLLHKGLNHVDDESLVVLADEKKVVKEKDETNNSVNKTIGNVYEDSEVTFEFAVRSREELVKLLGQPESNNSNQANNNKEKDENSAQLPFQVQITYTRLNGTKCVRVLTKSKKITTDRAKAEESVDAGVMGAHVYQQSAKLAQKGDYQGAMFNNWRAQNMLTRNANNDERKQVLHTFTAGSRGFNEQMTKASASPMYKPTTEKKEQDDYAEERNDEAAASIYNFKNAQKNKKLFKKK